MTNMFSIGLKNNYVTHTEFRRGVHDVFYYDATPTEFKPSEYRIAVKVVDNDGLESIEVIRLKVNGKIEMV